MKNISIRLADVAKSMIPIGYEGEQNHTRVTFYCGQIFDEYPDAAGTMVIKPVVGDVYPQTVERSGNNLIWDVTAANCAVAGSGQYQFTFQRDEEIIKTIIGSFSVNHSLAGDGEPPSPVTEWVEAANAKLAEVEQFVQEIDSKLDAPDFAGRAGQVLTSDGNGGQSWEDIDSGTADYSELTNKPTINNVVLSGNKTLSDLGIAAESDIPDVSGFYTKPSGGIPKTDMASAAQTSLGKADTAYQKPSGGIPASDIASGVIPDVSGFYTKPNTGIPKTDMASAVQTSLGKADTAYQKPGNGIPASDLASGVIPEAEVSIGSTQPQETGNKIWIEEDAEEEYIIPTTADMQTAIETRIAKPAAEGTSGQVLRTNGDGTTYWDDNASASEIGEAVTDWLDENVPTGETLVVDSSLSIAGAAAEAKAVGDLKSAINGRIYTETETSWLPGTISSGGGVVDNASYKYSTTPIPVKANHIYTINYGNPIFRVKYYATEPTIGTTVPTSGTDTTATSYVPASDGWAVFIAANDNIGDIIENAPSGISLASLNKRMTEAENDIDILKLSADNLNSGLVSGNCIALPLSWEYGIINAEGQEASENFTNFARTKGYFVSDKTLTIHLERYPDQMNSFVICSFDGDDVMQTRDVRGTNEDDGSHKFVYQLSANVRYRFCMTAPNNIVFQLDNMSSYGTIEMEILTGQIGLKQLVPSIANNFVTLTDFFATAGYYFKFNSGVTKTKSENAIAWENIEATARVTYDCLLVENHTYALYYDLVGVASSGIESYGFKMSLVIDSFTMRNAIEFSAPSNTTASGVFVFTVPTGGSGYPFFNLTDNRIGQEISGNMYFYDITDIPQDVIGRIDFSAIGNEKTIILDQASTQKTLLAPQWYGKVWTTYGDSITECSGNKNGWQDFVNPTIGFSKHNFRGHGGSEITYFQTSDPSAMTWTWTNPDDSTDVRTVARHGCMFSRIQTIPQNSELVFIMFGTNDMARSPVTIGDCDFDSTQVTDTDWQTYAEANNLPTGDFKITTYKGAICSTIMKVQRWCPNAVIVIGTQFSGKGLQNNTDINTEFWENLRGEIPLDYAKAAKEASEHMSVPCIDVFGTTGVNQLNRNLWLKDQVHPSNPYGWKMIARSVIGGLVSILPMSW